MDNYFDNDYVFFDSDVEKAIAYLEGGNVEVVLKKDVEAVIISRADAVALAKHFNII